MDIQVGNIVKLKKQHPLRQQGMGGSEDRGGFSFEMHGLRPSNHGPQEACGKKRAGNTGKGLN